MHKMELMYSLILIFGFIGILKSEKVKQCADDLINNNVEFRASSHKVGNNNYRASDARLAFANNQPSYSDKAWCPKNPVFNKKSKEWIEVDFNRNVMIRFIFTKGLLTSTFTPLMIIQYERNGKWKDFNNGTALKANNDARIEQMTGMNFLITRKLRIYPVANGNSPKEVCLAFGSLGCYVDDFVTHYDMEDGDYHYDMELKLRDRRYDGVRQSRNQASILTGGLGLLMDNEYVVGKLNGKLKDEVVGWKCTRPVNITFYFSQYRIINLVTFYFAYSPPTIVLPASVSLQIFPSKDQLHFSNFTNPKINLTLKHSHASLKGSKYVRVTLKCPEFSSGAWIMPSEIRFNTVAPMLPTPIPPLNPTQSSKEIGKKRYMYKTTGSPIYGSKNQMLKDTTLLVIISVSILVLLVLVCGVAFVFYKLHSSTASASASKAHLSSSYYSDKKLHILQSPLPGSNSHSNLTVFPSNSSCLSVSIPHCNFPVQPSRHTPNPVLNLHPSKSAMLSSSTDHLPTSSSLYQPNASNCYSVLTMLPNGAGRARQFNAPILPHHHQVIEAPQNFHGVYSGSTSQSSTTLGDVQQGPQPIPGDGSTNNTTNHTLYSSWPNTADEEDDTSNKGAPEHSNGVSVKGLIGKSISSTNHKDIEHQRLLGIGPSQTGGPFLSTSTTSPLPLPPPPPQNHQTNSNSSYDYSTLKEYSLYQPDNGECNFLVANPPPNNRASYTEDYSLLGTSTSHNSIGNSNQLHNQFPNNLIPMTTQYPIRMQYQPLNFSNQNKSTVDPPIRVNQALSNYLKRYRGVCGDVNYRPLSCSLPNCPMKSTQANFTGPFHQSEAKDIKIINSQDSIISQSNSKVLCQGQYGSVLSILPLTKNSNNNNTSGHFILKQLSQVSTRTAKSEFIQELRSLCRLSSSNDTNLATLHSIVLHNGAGSSVDREIDKAAFSLLLHASVSGSNSSLVNLKYFLRNSKPDFNNNISWILEQVVRALYHLHESGLTHGDIGSRSCGIDPVSGSVKLYPGGCIEDACCKEDYVACVGSLDNEQNEMVTMVPVRWLAPEVLRGERESCTSDIWSLGVLSWELVTKGRLRPYSSLTDASLLGGMMASEASCPRLALPPSSPHTKLLTQCMQYEPHNRVTAAQLLKH